MQMPFHNAKSSREPAMGTAPWGGIGRPLSASERWYWICDQIAPLQVYASCSVQGALTDGQLKRALKGLQQKHPLLNANVIADPQGENPRFLLGGTPDIPCRRLQPDVWGEAHYILAVENELNTAFDTQRGPLLRVSWIEHPRRPYDEAPAHTLILCISHIIADGYTTIALLKELVEGIAPERSQAVPACSPKPKLLPPPEEVFPIFYRGLRALLPMIISQLGVLWTQLRCKPLRVGQAFSSPQRKTRIISKTLSPAVLARTIAACKKQGVTVHGAICAAVLQAIHDHAELFWGHRQASACYGLGVPVSFRGELEPPVTHELGCYVATLATYYALAEDTDFWLLAREVNSTVKAQMERGEHFSVLNLLKYLGPKSKAKSAKFAQLVQSKGPGSVAVSNIGRFEFPEELGGLKVNNPQGGASLSIFGYFFSGICTTQDHLRWNFSYIEGILPRPHIELLADACVAKLMAHI